MTALTSLTMDDVRKALVHITPEGEPETSGLGIVSGEYIFTCAHYADVVQFPTNFLGVPLFDVRRHHDGAEGTLAMYVATSTDFMTLAADGVFEGLSEGGPTETASNVLIGETEDYNAIRPSTLIFAKNTSHRAVLPGLFFGIDGETVHEVELVVRRNSPLITYFSNDMVKGCSGGPIFTKDLHLIGINANMGDQLPGHDRRECLGRRIDLCSPLFLHREIEWQTFHID